MTESDRPPGRRGPPEGGADKSDEAKVPARAELLPVLPLRDIVVFPHMIVPLFVGREKSRPRAGSGDEGRQADPAGRPEERRAGRPVGRRHLSRRHGLHDPAAAQAAGRHREGAGRGRPPRQDHRLQGDRGLFRGVRRADAGPRRRRQGAGGARPHGGRPVRAVHQAQQEDRARGAGLAEPDRGAVASSPTRSPAI